MKLLLTEDVEKLGIVGDVVVVTDGYARNYLLPQRKATEPTDANMRCLAEARKAAEARRRTLREAQLFLAEKLKEVEVTIAAAANPEGVLYGSVGPREISAALADEGYQVDAAAIDLHTPIKALDNVREHVKNTIAPFKYPRKIEFVDELPKTQSGKIKRRILRQREFQQ